VQHPDPLGPEAASRPGGAKMIARRNSARGEGSCILVGLEGGTISRLSRGRHESRVTSGPLGLQREMARIIEKSRSQKVSTKKNRRVKRAAQHLGLFTNDGRVRMVIDVILNSRRGLADPQCPSWEEIKKGKTRSVN